MIELGYVTVYTLFFLWETFMDSCRSPLVKALILPRNEFVD